MMGVVVMAGTHHELPFLNSSLYSLLSFYDIGLIGLIIYKVNKASKNPKDYITIQAKN